jgi:hypothetical protein
MCISTLVFADEKPKCTSNYYEISGVRTCLQVINSDFEVKNVQEVPEDTNKNGAVPIEKNGLAEIVNEDEAYSIEDSDTNHMSELR